jgi:hypothetical protein
MNGLLLTSLEAVAFITLSPSPAAANNIVSSHGGEVDLAAVVMDCGGNDPNPGTLASPVKTFARAHALMGTGGGHTYLRGSCIYPVSTNIWQYSNETYEGYPADTLMSAEVDIGLTNVGCSSCSNLAIRNLKIVGSNSFAPMMQFSAPSSLFIEANWIVDTVQQPLAVFNSNNLYIRGNKFDVRTTSAKNDVTTTFNDNADHFGLFITDNAFINCVRMCIEAQGQNSPRNSVNNVHIDRNSCKDCMTVLAGTFNYISAVTGAGSGSTVSGNNVSRAAGTPCYGAIEVVMYGTTISDNQETNICWGYTIAQDVGSVFQNNSLTYDLTTTHQGFTQDGAYDHAEWIGVNHYNVGSGFTDVAGCPPNTPPSYCTLGFNDYGRERTTFPASTPYRYEALPVGPARQGHLEEGRAGKAQTESPIRLTSR